MGTIVNVEDVPRHRCMLYEGTPSPHLPGIARIIAEKLKANKRCLYFNSPVMVAGIRSYLYGAGINVTAEVEKRSLLLSCDQTHLIEGRFDANAMLSLLAAAVDQAHKDQYAGLWAAGDMTWEFGPEGSFARLHEYETRLEELFRHKPTLEGICLYHLDTLPPSAPETALNTHRVIYINETLSRMSQYYANGVAAGPALRPVPVAEVRRMMAKAPAPNDQLFEN